MKNKITILFLIGFSIMNAQQKTIGPIALSTNMNASMILDNDTSTVTLTLSGPNDRWFALQFGSFTGGMQAGSDLVYWNDITLVDARHNGQGITPTVDVTNNWTLVSNTNNSPSAGLRTLVYSRPFNTGDANDYTFNFNDATIDLAWARFSSASFTLAYHGAANRGVFLDNAITLGIDDFSLNNSKLYPNPSDGSFIISTKAQLIKVNVYSHTGAFIKTIEIENVSDTTEIDLIGLQAGIYLLELQGITNKSWKKVIVK